MEYVHTSVLDRLPSWNSVGDCFSVTLGGLPWCNPDAADFPPLLQTSIESSAIEGLEKIELSQQFHKLSLLDRFSLLAIALAAAGRLLNTGKAQKNLESFEEDVRSIIRHLKVIGGNTHEDSQRLQLGDLSKLQRKRRGGEDDEAAYRPSDTDSETQKTPITRKRKRTDPTPTTPSGRRANKLTPIAEERSVGKRYGLRALEPVDYSPTKK
jgi:hypothetical protein